MQRIPLARTSRNASTRLPAWEKAVPRAAAAGGAWFTPPVVALSSAACRTGQVLQECLPQRELFHSVSIRHQPAAPRTCAWRCAFLCPGAAQRPAGLGAAFAAAAAAAAAVGVEPPEDIVAACTKRQRRSWRLCHALARLKEWWVVGHSSKVVFTAVRAPEMGACCSTSAFQGGKRRGNGRGRPNQAPWGRRALRRAQRAPGAFAQGAPWVTAPFNWPPLTHLLHLLAASPAARARAQGGSAEPETPGRRAACWSRTDRNGPCMAC